MAAACCGDCASSATRAETRARAAWRTCFGSRSSTATTQPGGPARTSRWPPARSAVGGISLKQKCEKVTAERRSAVEARFLRKPGQSDVDPVTGDYTTGQFESWTRFELLDPNYRKP